MNNLTDNQNSTPTTEKIEKNASLTQSLNPSAITTKKDGSHTLELLAEVPQVVKERIITGNLKLTKQIKTQTINVPVTLTQEVLVIEHTAVPVPVNTDNLVQVIDQPTQPSALLTINGEAVSFENKPIEIVLSRQIAKVAIETQVAENVKVVTHTQTHEQTIPVTLRHEELVTEEVKLDTPTVISSEVLDETHFTK